MHDGAETAERGGGAERDEHLQAPPEVVEAQDLPALAGGDAGEVGVGIDDDGVPDGAQHRQVGLGVGVGVGGGEVDALARGELAQRVDLALAVVEGPGGAAGVAAFDDLQARADAAVEGEHVGEQVGHLLGGGGDDVDGLAGVLVAVGALEHLRVQAREHAGEHARGHALQVADGDAGEHLPHPHPDGVGPVVGRAAQAEAQVLVEVAEQLRARDHARLEGRAREEDARRSRPSACGRGRRTAARARQ